MANFPWQTSELIHGYETVTKVCVAALTVMQLELSPESKHYTCVCLSGTLQHAQRTRELNGENLMGQRC